MKSYISCFHLALLIVLFSLLQACEKHSPQPGTIDFSALYAGLANFDAHLGYAPESSTSSIGDFDGCGIGLDQGEMWLTNSIEALAFDYRDYDPGFTDVFPAAIDGVINYVHFFEAPLDTVTNANFTFWTLGIEDSSLQEVDIKLYIDGDEIVGAFDNINQVTNYNDRWIQTYDGYKIDIPFSLLHHLQDGEVEVRWEVVQLGTDQITDDFAIDTSSLLVYWTNNTPVPDVKRHSIALGDVDHFGTGIPNSWRPDSEGPLPNDNRTSTDPYFTDIYPANFDGLIEYDFQFNIPTDSIISADFHFSTFGIQDHDMRDLAFNDTDIKFFFDGNEIKGAFDSINQLTWSAGKALPVSGGFSMPVPNKLLKYIQDGEVSIRIEIYQYGSSGELDIFAIDYIWFNYSTLIP
jgi:hypothetical protein